MLVVKNTFGISSVLSPAVANTEKIGGFGGSSLDRKKYDKRVKSFIEELLKKPLELQEAEKKITLRSMSKRTKAKIRRKIIAFARINDKLSFLTLTFCNEIEDQKAVKQSVVVEKRESASKLLSQAQSLPREVSFILLS